MENKTAEEIDQDKQTLAKCFNDVIWMAIRYANGRNTYAPSMVREAVNNFKKVFPDWKLEPDCTIQPPSKLEIPALKSDYLFDLFESKTDNL